MADKRFLSRNRRRSQSAAVIIGLAAVAVLSSGLLRGSVPTVQTGTWVASGEFNASPVGAASVALADGRLLVFGGDSSAGPSTGVAAYDPVTASWSTAGSLTVGRAGHAAAVLADGRVLIAGGITAAGPTFDVEIYDPESGISVHAGDMTVPRSGHAVATLKDGRVLIAGGSDGVSPLSGVELFDPKTGQSGGIAATLSSPRVQATATTMLDGHVLVVGGSDGTADLKTAEVYDPASATFFTTGAMQSARSGHSAVLLPNNNQVLIAGGSSAGVPLSSAELYADWRDGFSTAGTNMSAARVGAVAGGLQAHSLGFVAGGGSLSGEYYGYATVKTDRDDYWPGEPVTITGSGWQPGETVTLTITEDADTHNDFIYTAVADAAGNISNSEFAPIQNAVFQHFGMRFYVRARGAASEALNTFTDGNGTITGVVRDSVTSAPIAGATVTCSNTGTNPCNNVATTTTNGSGQYTLTFQFPGNSNTVNISASASRYATQTQSLSFSNGQTRTVNWSLVSSNAAPSATAQSVTTNEDAAKTIALAGTDPDGNALTFSIVSGPANGTLGTIGAATCSGTPTSCSANVTYTPAANFNGSDSFTFKVNDGTVDSSPATVSITVTAVNDAPTFTKGPNQTVLEDAGAQTVAGWATSMSAGPANESTQTLTFTAINDNDVLFSSQPSIATDGTLTYTPAANASGLATVTVRLKDDGGAANGGADSTEQTFTITVNAVNDAPTFTKGADQTVLEDAGAQAVSGWATAISAGAANESGQTLTFTTTNDNNALFASQPSVAADGTLTYTPAADASGSVTVTVKLSDDGGTADGGVDSSQQTFTIMVTPVNDAPSFTKGSDQTVNEDAGAQTVTGWATGISAGPNESSQTVSFIVTNNSNPSLFSAAPSVDASGHLAYTAAADANGSATITLVIKDDGGTSNGGVDTSAPQTFVITVNAVNDAPAFTKGADQTVLEDAGPQTVAGWASGMSAGPADESGQTLTFATTNSNNALFSSQPSVAANGTLTYTSAPDANGTAVVTVRLSDNGGTANGGVDFSEQTFTINVTPVNDAPANVTATLSASSIAENNSATVSGSFTDPDNGDTHTVTIVWSDGSANTVLNLPAGTFVYSASHQYLDDNPTASAADVHAIGVTVADDGSPMLSGTAGANLTVDNVAPAISALTGPTAPQPLGTSVTVTGTFSDQGTRDTHTCAVTWDDGATTSGTVSETNGSGTCTASRTFAGPGVYSIDMKITDDDTGNTTRPLDSEYVVVFDPSGGFVTGGGWIISPAGASPIFPTATGKANFGFVSKYKKGSNVPEGQTEFQFKAGDLNFRSSAYDAGSLVVSGGKAQYRGTGTINGVAGYRFLLVAYDGDGPGGGGVDRFRIRITLGGAVVYDNGFGASEDLDAANPLAISGGSIEIHK